MNWPTNVIQFVQKWGNAIVKPILTKKHNIYLYYIRYKITNANLPEDLIRILKNIANINNHIATEDLFKLLIECLIKYPLTEIELQKISNWQQLYDNELGIYNYATATFWVCSVCAIQESEQQLLY